MGLLAAEVVKVGLDAVRAVSHLDAPAMDHRQTRAAVAQSDCHVDIPIGELDRVAMSGHSQDMSLSEANASGRVILVRGDKQRFHPGEQRALGGACGSVR